MEPACLPASERIPICIVFHSVVSSRIEFHHFFYRCTTDFFGVSIKAVLSQKLFERFSHVILNSGWLGKKCSFFLFHAGVFDITNVAGVYQAQLLPSVTFCVAYYTNIKYVSRRAGNSELEECCSKSQLMFLVQWVYPGSDCHLSRILIQFKLLPGGNITPSNLQFQSNLFNCVSVMGDSF